MRRIMLVFALWCAWVPGIAAAKPRFPYIAYVSAVEAPLRSGPGEEHYPTDRLERGTKVEVHRHDPGGWYAVRPVAGSYSWVPARQVEMTEEADVGEVTKDGTVAWVGVRDGEVANLGWQIEFKKGDLVEVLGAKRLALAEGEREETCYKIAPPAGEFRWIKNKFVTRKSADELAEEPSEQPAADKKVQLAGLEQPLEASKSAGSKAPELRPIDPSESAAPALGGGPAFDGFVPRKKRSGDEKESPQAPVGTNSPAFKPASGPTPTPAPPAGSADGAFDTRLRELDVELSLVVAQPPAAWNLVPLRQKAVLLGDSGQSALERGQARVLVEKIDEFADFARRHQSTVGSRTSGPTPAKPSPTSFRPKGLIDSTTSPVGSGLRGSEFAPDIDPRYDGTGWLMPVHAQNRNVPAYALCDNDGKVLQYVTPATGLNLSRHLRTQVGVYGQRGYVTQLRTPHLTAHKIVSLERHRK